MFDMDWILNGKSKKTCSKMMPKESLNNLNFINEDFKMKGGGKAKVGITDPKLRTNPGRVDLREFDWQIYNPSRGMKQNPVIKKPILKEKNYVVNSRKLHQNFRSIALMRRGGGAEVMKCNRCLNVVSESDYNPNTSMCSSCMSKLAIRKPKGGAAKNWVDIIKESKKMDYCMRCGKVTKTNDYNGDCMECGSKKQ